MTTHAKATYDREQVDKLVEALRELVDAIDETWGISNFARFRAEAPSRKLLRWTDATLAARAALAAYEEQRDNAR